MKRKGNEDFIQPTLIYTKQQVCDMYYNDCLNINFRALLSSGYFEYKIIKLKDLYVRPNVCVDDWFGVTDNISLLNTRHNKLSLGEDVLKNGSYWIFGISWRDEVNGWIIRHGNHRIVSLKLLQAKGLIPDDFKIVAIVLNEKFLEDYKNNDKNKVTLLDNPVKIRYNKDVLENKVLYKSVYDNNLSFKEINEFTVETEINNLYDLFFSYHSYTLYLRNLLVEHNIPPTKMFINPNEFERWLNA